MGSALSLAEQYNEAYCDDDIDDSTSTDSGGESVVGKAGHVEKEVDTTILEDVKSCCAVCGCSKRNIGATSKKEKVK